MDSKKMAAAVAEAKRFIGRVQAWEKAQGSYTAPGGDTYPLSTPKEGGAVRRASMDLTRALADLRRAG